MGSATATLAVKTATDPITGTRYGFAPLWPLSIHRNSRRITVEAGDFSGDGPPRSRPVLRDSS
ncbi:hypothetical protein [Nocardia paucivorans]|uniref:hypothetical protein n=1 Tax=Nocardia paucivorans TaxID=114259 RepID=UPI0002F16885|nr:hypothetical protein [Nocardia paucivorans]